MRKVLLFPVRVFLELIFRPVYKRRVAEVLVGLCKEGAYVLDLGCDDGSLAEAMMKLKPSLRIVGVDVQGHRPARIPRKIYDGRNIPYKDSTFDVVMCVDVLHHIEDMEPVLAEAKRVSKGKILIKDHRRWGWWSGWLISLTDWISNAPYGIGCAFNFPTQSGWERLFGRVGLAIAEQPEDLDFGYGVRERYNPVFWLREES